MSSARALAICSLLLIGGTVRAESLRCAAGSISEGDSRLSVLYKCGQPVLSDATCSPVLYAGTLKPVPGWIASQQVPCQVTERLLYERGPGQLLATVTIRSGVVRSISYGSQPR